MKYHSISNCSWGCKFGNTVLFNNFLTIEIRQKRYWQSICSFDNCYFHLTVIIFILRVIWLSLWSFDHPQIDCIFYNIFFRDMKKINLVQFILRVWGRKWISYIWKNNHCDSYPYLWPFQLPLHLLFKSIIPWITANQKLEYFQWNAPIWVIDIRMVLYTSHKFLLLPAEMLLALISIWC